MHQHILGTSLYSNLKGVFGDSRQAVVHGASSTGIDYNLPYLIRFTHLRRPIRLHNAHESWKHTKASFRKVQIHLKELQDILCFIP